MPEARRESSQVWSEAERLVFGKQSKAALEGRKKFSISRFPFAIFWRRLRGASHGEWSVPEAAFVPRFTSGYDLNVPPALSLSFNEYPPA